MSDNFLRRLFLETGTVSPTLGSTVTGDVVTGRFTGMTSQVLSNRFVEGYKKWAFKRRKTGVAETNFLVSIKNIHPRYTQIRLVSSASRFSFSFFTISLMTPSKVGLGLCNPWISSNALGQTGILLVAHS
jgi:hypothetical protein